jgi:uncharacterized protein YdaU (DUF1376 family)
VTARDRKNGMKPLPYYRWYVGDHLALERVQALNYIEKGLYRQLLDECWRKGYIPDDPLRLAELCKCPETVFVRAWKQVREMFITLDFGDGHFLTSERLEVERTEEDAKRVKASLAGKASAKKRNVRSTSVNERYIAVAEQSSSMDDRSLRSPDGARPIASVIANIPEVLDTATVCTCGSRGAMLAAGVHAPMCAVGREAARAV